MAAQTEQAWCVTLLTHSVVTWTTEYHGLAIAQMCAGPGGGRRALRAYLAGPSEYVNFFGTINVDVDTELAELARLGTGRCAPAARKWDDATQGVTSAVREEAAKPRAAGTRSCFR
ncbi:hypothetical protein [Streptomyces sp. NPDC049949]|uniref:hypothetical protein n=1 Tax=Streptomyces sp. NPDC049949 TaxID=3154627 RepID=UPI003432E479